MAESTLPYQDPSIVNRSLASQTVTRAAGVGGVAEREEIIVCDPTDASGMSKVTNSSPAATAYGQVVRPVLRAASTATRTQTADTGTESILLAANASRIGAAIFNDSSAMLYLGLGSTPVSTTDYTAKIFTNGYYRVPTDFTGVIRGVWASDPNDGGARITEW